MEDDISNYSPTVMFRGTPYIFIKQILIPVARLKFYLLSVIGLCTLYTAKEMWFIHHWIIKKGSKSRLPIPQFNGYH